jgi:hypothetical protein
MKFEEKYFLVWRHNAGLFEATNFLDLDTRVIGS